MSLLATRRRTVAIVCGFCQSNNHEHCPRGVRNGDGRVIPCGCDQPYCGGQVLRCLECKNENDGEVSPDGWRCLDREACYAEVQRRLDSNPHVQMVREVMIRVTENATAEKAEKAEKAPKAPTHCLHCGEPTKGGKFLPGHDARWVSELVVQVVDNGSRTEDAVVSQMAEAGASETLQAKFTKAVGLARADREKRAEAKAAAEAKKAEDEAAAKAKADAKLAKEAEKADTVAVPPPDDAKAEPAKGKASQKA